MKKILPIVILILLLIVLRIPFVTQYLFDWDAVQLALGMDEFNIEKHQPHPPGYFLYIYFAKFINIFLDNSNLAMIMENIILSIIALLIFYLIAKKIFKNEFLGFLASFIFITNPFIWFHSEFANIYIIDLCFSLIYFYTSYLIIIQNKNLLWLFSSLFALGIGFRQSLVIFFLPLYIYACLFDFKFTKSKIKKILLNVLIFSIVFLCWFIPNSIVVGGFIKLLGISKNQFLASSKTTSILSMAKIEALGGQFFNTFKLLIYSSSLLSLFSFIAIFYKKIKISKKNSIIFLLSILPSFLFYSLIHLGKIGYIMTISGIFMTLGLFTINKLFKESSRIIIILFIIILQLPLFIYGIDGFITNKTLLINVSPYDVSYLNLKNSDLRIRKTIYEIKKYDPDDTILITEADSPYIIPKSNFIKNMRLGGYYLPKYHLYNIFNDGQNKKYYYINNKKTNLINSSRVSIPTNTKNILLITDNFNYDIYDFKKNSGFEEIFHKRIENQNEFEYLGYTFIKNL
ncbi:MAG: glycosyltransferase family 39 protein [Patescibacteria group bacterium]|nr:glycosyltransferase family 39 protein [Patescibacteria group bacterium]